VTSNKPKKENKPNWRHYNFTTAGPVDDYLYSMLPKRDEVLAGMEEYASKHDVPIVGPAVARVLQEFALMINAKTVFELGSAIGYSTIWWAQAVGEKGRVIYTDGDPKNAERARGYFERAGVSSRITLHTGDALEVLSEQKQEFDIIFNDVDKEDYPRVLRLVSPRLRKGGLFITDMSCGAGGSRRRIRRKRTPRPSSSSTDCFTARRIFLQRSCRFAMAWRLRLRNSPATLDGFDGNR